MSADPYSDLGTHRTFTIEVREFPQAARRRWTITVHRSITVGQLKHMIEQRSGVEEKSQRFVVRGTELRDKNQTIEEVSIGQVIAAVDWVLMIDLGPGHAGYTTDLHGAIAQHCCPRSCIRAGDLKFSLQIPSSWSTF